MKIFNDLKNNKYKSYLPDFKKEKNQNYLTLILTFSSSIVFALFAINPTLSTIAKLNKEIADGKIVDARLKEKINNISSLYQAYAKIENDLNYIYSAVPQKPEAPDLLAQIQAVANDSNVVISSFQLTPVQLTGENVTESFSFDVTAQGDFESLSNFTKNLTTMQRVISIDSINISQFSTTSLQISLKSTAYFKK